MKIMSDFYYERKPPPNQYFFFAVSEDEWNIPEVYEECVVCTAVYAKSTSRAEVISYQSGKKSSP